MQAARSLAVEPVEHIEDFLALVNAKLRIDSLSVRAFVLPENVARLLLS